MERNRLSDRKSSFMKTLKVGSGRHRRAQTTLRIRKERKDEQLKKRRADADAAATDRRIIQKFSAKDIPSLVGVLRGNGSNEDYGKAAAAIRYILAVDVDGNAPLVDQVIAHGGVRLLVNCLPRNESPKLQLDAAWILTSVASTKYASGVFECGAAAPLIGMLQPDQSVRCRIAAATCLATCLETIASNPNAARFSKYRDAMIQTGLVKALMLGILKDGVNPNLAATALSIASDVCIGEWTFEIEAVKPLIAAFKYYLASREFKMVNDEAIVNCCCGLLNVSSNGDKKRIEAVVDAIPHLIDLLKSKSSDLLAIVLRTLGNLAEDQAQCLIDHGFMDRAMMLIDHPKPVIIKDACWLLASICTGKPQISAVLDKPDVVDRLVDRAQHAVWPIREDAIGTLANMFNNGSRDQVVDLVQKNGLLAMCSALHARDIGVLLSVLQAIRKALLAGKDQTEDFTTLVDEYDALDKLYELQMHNSPEVSKTADAIVKECEAENDENVSPWMNTASPCLFKFT